MHVSVCVHLHKPLILNYVKLSYLCPYFCFYSSHLRREDGIMMKRCSYFYFCLQMELWWVQRVIAACFPMIQLCMFLVVSYSFWLWQLDHSLFEQVSERCCDTIYIYIFYLCLVLYFSCVDYYVVKRTLYSIIYDEIPTLCCIYMRVLRNYVYMYIYIISYVLLLLLGS